MLEFIDQIEFAKNAVLDDQIFQRWIVGYQFDCTFDDFKNRLTKNTKTIATNKSKEEILDDVRSIITLCEGGGSIV